MAFLTVLKAPTISIEVRRSHQPESLAIAPLTLPAPPEFWSRKIFHRVLDFPVHYPHMCLVRSSFDDVPAA